MINKIFARKILNSRGTQTIEVEVHSTSGMGVASAPSGASAGKHEAVAFPKGGVDDAVRLVNGELSKKLAGLTEGDLGLIDSKIAALDGTKNFSRLGGSASIATSMAVLKSAAGEKPLFKYMNPKANAFPFPLGNVIGGGAHGGGTDIQEFLLLPLGAKTASEAVFSNAEVHARVGSLLAEMHTGFLRSRNDEGGWSVGGHDSEGIFDVLCDAIEDWHGMKLGIDVAATQLWDGGNYVYTKENNKRLSPGEQIDFMVSLAKKYPLAYIEDPLHEEDFEGFAELTKKANGRFLVCGDDLFVTNTGRLERGIGMGACNSLIIKPNQNGLVSSTENVVKTAKKAGYSRIVSHRSGETTDPGIAHFAVAWGAQLLKSGITGGERTAKLNELIRMWELVEKPRMAVM